MCTASFYSPLVNSIHRGLFPKSCFETRLPSLISTEAHHSYEQADTGSNMTCSNNEMAHLATALAQRDQSLMVLAPGKTNGVEKLLVWLVGDHKYSCAWQNTDFSHRMRYSRVFLIALWMVFNSAYMGTSLNLPKSWSYTHSLLNTVMERMVNDGLWD